MIGIYKITNPTGKIYIGQSLDIYRRFKRYKSGDCKNQYALYASLIKYGWTNHSFEILEICKKSELNNKERYYQELYCVMSENGLNCVYVNSEGIKMVYSEQSTNKMSVSAKKRIVSEIRKKHQSDIMKGRIYTDEHKRKSSEGNKGKEHWWNKGKPTSLHQKEMASMKNKVKVFQYDTNLNFIKEWDSIKSAGFTYGSNGSSISACARGKNKTAFGFIWRYEVI